MNPIIENLTGMNALSDQVVAMDLLIAAKSELEITPWQLQRPERLKLKKCSLAI